MDQGIIEVVTGAEAAVYIQTHSVIKKRVPKKYRTATRYKIAKRTDKARSEDSIGCAKSWCADAYNTRSQWL